MPGTPPDYGNFLSAFRGYGFDDKNLIDGQAVQMHDALQTVEKAVLQATPGDSSRAPAAGEVRGVLLSLNGVYEVLGAGGIMNFSASLTGAGNPRGKPLPVLKFPSPPDDPSGQQVMTTYAQE